jgi:lipoprotein-anchoring transpeptidase ErfK/SrfK
MRKLAIVCAVLFLAAANASAHAGVVARIDISKQIMTVSENGAVKYAWPVSTGRKGYRTPRGSYRPTRLHKMWYSRKYDNSPMPHSIFFRGGYAIHGTNYTKSLGRPASHGCVRLHPSHARTLFKLVLVHGRANTRIILTN